LARGIDESSVVPNRPTQSISAEDRFEKGCVARRDRAHDPRLAEKTWTASRKESGIARTVILELKTA
jgi:DNA polymerase-4